MPDIERLTISLEKSLLAQLERAEHAGLYASRSDLFRDLIRSRLVEHEWERDGEALGTITLVYDHDQRTLSRRLTRVQHHHHGAVLATTHVHLDDRICAEMIMVRGKASEIRHLADELGHQKGVLHSALSMSSAGKGLPAKSRKHSHADGTRHAHP